MNRKKQAARPLQLPLVKEERLSWILDRLSIQGKVLAGELCTALGVSEDTIRRDLRELAASRRVQRVHGGALRPAPAALSFDERSIQSVAEKKSIARAAIRLMERGMVVFMDGGTTNVQVAESLPEKLALTVITNSLPVAMVLSGSPSIEVIQVGGTVLRSSRVTVGADAVDAVREFRADLFLLGTCSLDIRAGVTVPHREEASLKRAMIQASERVVGLVTGEKLGTASAYVVASADQLDFIVTESATSNEAVAPYRSIGIEVIRGEEID